MSEIDYTRDIPAEEDMDDVQEHDGHRDRIRLNILGGGADALRPLHILEFLLYYVLPRQDVESVARTLLDHFGDLVALFGSGLEDFRQVKGLGETGAQWLDMIGSCMRKFANLEPGNSIVLENHLHLMNQARQMRAFVKIPFCVQLLADENDLLVLRRPLAPTLRWADMDVLRAALDDASGAAARRAYMLVYTPNHRQHPNAYDMEHIRDYALLLKHAGCALRDVLFISDSGSVSMRRMNLLPDLTVRKTMRRLIAEDETEALMERDLKIIAPFQEDENHEHNQPV